MGKNVSAISLAQRLHEQELFYFTPHLIADLLAVEVPAAYRLVARLKQMGLIAQVERGKYLLLGLQPEHVLANPLFIASQLVTPAYVSYWSALHFYGFTEQAPRTVFAATTRRQRPVAFHGFDFRFVTVRPHKFFGYRREQVGDLPVLIADEAKVIIDSLDQLRYAGGIVEVAGALRKALEEVDASTLVEYARQMHDRSLASRLGYLLTLSGRAQAAEALPVSASPIKLDPTRPAAGQRVSRWHLMVNVPEGDLFSPGVG